MKRRHPSHSGNSSLDSVTWVRLRRLQCGKLLKGRLSNGKEYTSLRRLTNDKPLRLLLTIIDSVNPNSNRLYLSRLNGKTIHHHSTPISFNHSLSSFSSQNSIGSNIHSGHSIICTPPRRRGQPPTHSSPASRPSASGQGSACRLGREGQIAWWLIAYW